MHMKTKWLKRLAAAVLSIGLAFAPAVAESGLTYADVKAPERDRSIMVASGSEASPGDASSSNATITPISATKVEMEIGGTETLKVSVSPSNAKVVWSTKDSEFVTVTGNGTTGTVKAVAAGKAKVTASLESDSRKFVVFDVNVTEPAVDPKPDLEAIILDKTDLSLEVGQTDILKATLSPSDATAAITWKSNNENVATVDNSGLVKAIAEGSAEITATSGGITGTCNVTVTAKAEVPELSITGDNSKPVELKVDETKLLEVNVTPQNEAVKWETANKDIVRVSYVTASNAKAEVTALKAGEATVTASLEKDPQKKVSFKIQVSENEPVDPDPPTEPEKPVTELKLEPSELLLTKGSKGTLKVTNKPENTELKWDSADPKVAAVENGVVTALAAGETTITVSGENCKEASAVVTVTEETGAVLEGDSEVTVSVNKAAVEVSRENLPDSVTAQQLADAKNAAVDAALNSVKNNTAVLEPAEGLKEAVNVKLPEGYKGVSRVDSELKDMEMIAEMADGKLVVRPSRLVYDASVAMDVFDENGNLKTPDRKVVNSELDGYVTFRLAVPKTVTEKYAQIVHKSAGYSDSSISNLEIQNKGTDNAYISVKVRHFSEFDVTFTNSRVSTGSSGSSGGSGGSRSYKAPTEGTWVRDAAGWWYKFPNHTWPANCWTQLTWNGVSQWYRFNEAGYMVAGWYLDTDGNWYFLHNVSDGTQGHMYTGWHQIEGKWYYFRENAGGPVGSLVVNGTTPDGYTVDASGAWIQ